MNSDYNKYLREVAMNEEFGQKVYAEEEQYNIDQQMDADQEHYITTGELEKKQLPTVVKSVVLNTKEKRPFEKDVVDLTNDSDDEEPSKVQKIEGSTFSDSRKKNVIEGSQKQITTSTNTNENVKKDDVFAVVVPKKVRKSVKDTRINALNFFCTFPQCSMPMNEVMSRITQLFGDNFDYGVVSEEKHQDGSPHIHTAFHLKQQMKVSHSFLDQITGKRGNYQAARDIGAAMTYVIKDGRNFKLF